MTHEVQIFDRPCCGPSAAATLADFLKERLPAEEIAYHDLGNATGKAVVPTSVVDHLIGGGPLPVMTVDGDIVCAGTLPNLMDALDLASGAAPTGSRALPLAGGSTCC